MAAPPRGEVSWDTLDKQRFVLYGLGTFTGVTTLLYPLSVAKTRLQTEKTAGSLVSTVRKLLANEGIPGLYRGFSTVLLGSVPIRGVYLTAFEVTKARLRAVELPAEWAVSPALHTGVADFTAGAFASCCSQAIVIPVDVVSQRLMVQNAGAGEVVYSNGWAAARGILRTEGLGGLFRGAGASLLIYVPSSGLWWGCYGAYQSSLWSLLHRADVKGDVVLVQISAALMAGATSGCLTTPLDVVKTRLQTYAIREGERAPTFRSIATTLFREEGCRGFVRGIGPRMASAMAWGTCMSSAFEALKRFCAKPADSPQDAG